MVVHGSWNGVSGCKGLGDLALSVSLYGKEDGLLPFDFTLRSHFKCYV